MLLVLCAVAFVTAVRGSWIDRRPLAGQYRQGFFETGDEPGGRVDLVLDAQREDLFFPNLTFNYRGTIDVPPGTTVALTPVAGARYALTGGDDGWLPYLVIGHAERLTAANGEPVAIGGTDPGAARLVGARRLGVQGGKVGLSAWDASLPYRDDHRLLEALHRACAGSAGASRVQIEVAPSFETLSIEYGSCNLTVPLEPRAIDGLWQLVIVGGLEWVTVERLDGGLRTVSSVDFASLRAWSMSAVAAGGGLAFIFGMPTAVILSAVLLVASALIHPLLSALCLVLIGVLVIAGLPIAIVRRLVPVRLRTTRSVLIVAYCLIAALALARSTRDSGESAAGLEAVSVRERIESIGGAPACVLAGYSTVNDVQLRAGTNGTWQYLARHCEPCRDGVARYGQSGRTFVAIRELACATDAPLARGTPLVFLGGTNDDSILGDDYFFWAARLGVRRAVVFAYEAIVPGLYYLGRPSGSRLRRMADAAADRMLPLIDAQRDVIRSTVECLDRRGARLWYFHDFTILDLRYGRSAARSRMLEARREAVIGSGNHFVNLLEAFGDDAGVSWFNDYIHLSTLGHRRVADRVCAELSR